VRNLQYIDSEAELRGAGAGARWGVTWTRKQLSITMRFIATRMYRQQFKLR